VTPHPDDHDPLIMGTVEDARARMLASVAALPVEDLPLGMVHGRILAAEVVATHSQPPCDISAMDGYALKFTDAPGTLVVVGESRAGAGFEGTLAQAQAARIFTGAPIPAGANCVIPQEDVPRSGNRIRVMKARGGWHIRREGTDFVTGQQLIAAGTRLDPIALALAAAAGAATVTVARRPRIAIMTGGDELVPVGGALTGQQIFDSMTPALVALVEAWGGEARPLAPARDSLQSLKAGFKDALDGADLVVTIGGASVGEHDLMKPALEAFQSLMQVNKVLVRPGKPVWFATTGEGNKVLGPPVLGLPGNPASALVCAHLFLRPLMEAMLGRDPALCLKMTRARLTTALEPAGEREHWLRAHVVQSPGGVPEVTPAETQDSALLSVFNGANCLIRMRGGDPGRPAGGPAEVLLLNRD
jgi:molybdopterin molybdotransferase